MKVFTILILSFVLWPSIADAQTLPRDALIDRVESFYLQTTMLSPDSPVFDMLLDSAKTANPGVKNDTWLGIKNELAPVLSKVMTEKGGSLDKIIRKSVESLSDTELDKLGQILNDQIYRKFQVAMTNPSSQKELMGGMFNDVLKFTSAINDVLAHHGLNQVH